MANKFDKSCHMGEAEDEIQITEFELQLWRVFSGFVIWQEDCERYVCNDTLSASEIALLHVIRMNDRPKTIYELGRLLNRDDPNNIQYSLSKLIKFGFIEKDKPMAAQKTLSYKITEAGMNNTDAFTEARKSILFDLFKNIGIGELGLEKITNALIKINGIYGEASRLAASYKKK